MKIFTLIITLTILSNGIKAQDSIFNTSKSFEEKTFYDTITDFCKNDFQGTDSVWYRYRYVSVYDINGNNVSSVNYYNGLEDVKVDAIYDGNNKIIETKYFFFDTITTNWQVFPFQIETISYNLNGDVIQKQTEKVDSTGVNYIVSVLKDNVYDANYNLIKKTVRNYSDITNSLFISYIYDYQYDGNNNVISQIDSMYNTYNGQWSVGNQIFVYNSNNNIILVEENSTNSFSKKLTLTYDLNGNNTSILNSYWDTISNSWLYGQYSLSFAVNGIYFSMPNSKLVQTFDSNGNILGQNYYDYIDSLGTFLLVKQFNQVYNLNNNVVQSISNDYSSTAQVLLPMYKTEYIYNNNLMIKRTSYTWDTISNSWNNYTIQDYSYDSNGNIIYYADFYWDEFESAWKNMNIYQPCASFTSVKEQEKHSSIVFPNPTSGTIHLNDVSPGSIIQVMDITGRLLFNSVINNEQTTYNLNDYGNAGIYLIRITSPRQKSSVTHKIILQ